MKWSIWRDHGLPWPVQKMTLQQYLIIATHKQLDELEKEGKPYKRSSKDMDQLWLDQIKEAQKKYDEKQKIKEKETKKSKEFKEKEIFNKKKQSTISIEEKIKQDQQAMMEKIIWDREKEN